MIWTGGVFVVPARFFQPISKQKSAGRVQRWSARVLTQMALVCSAELQRRGRGLSCQGRWYPRHGPWLMNIKMGGGVNTRRSL